MTGVKVLFYCFDIETEQEDVLKYKGFCVIRTKKENVVNTYTIATYDFMKNNHYYNFDNSNQCDSFEILENVDGQLIVEVNTKMRHSGIKIKSTMTFEKGIVEEIRIENFIKS